MLTFNNYPPEQPGDVELAGAGTQYDMELMRDEDHALFGGASTEGFRLLGMMAGHGVSEPRLNSDAITATPESTLDIIKPVVDQIGSTINTDSAVWFARGIFHAIRVDFPDFYKRSEWERNTLFQNLISGVSEETANAVAGRRNSCALPAAPPDTTTS